MLALWAAILPLCRVRSLIRFLESPALTVVNDNIELDLAVVLLVFCLAFAAFSRWRKLRALRRFLELGDLAMAGNQGSQAGTLKQNMKNRQWGFLFLLLLYMIAMLRSCGSGGPIEQQLRYGERFPALQLLEEGAILPVPGRKTGLSRDTGNVIHYQNLLLNNHYRVTQQAIVLPPGPKAPSDALPKASSEPSAAATVTAALPAAQGQLRLAKEKAREAELQAEYYDCRLEILADSLWSELHSQLTKEGYSFQAVPTETYQEYQTAESDGLQILLARQGKKLLLLKYRGPQNLSEQAETLAEIFY